MIRHAGLIARRLGGAWRGVLIEGPAGAGKSDLALRALDLGFRLVADDRTVVFVTQGRLFGRAPGALTGLMEVRGAGVFSFACLDFAQIVLTVRCVERPQDVERLPDRRSNTLLGIQTPSLDLWAPEASAPTKLLVALEQLGADDQPGYLAGFASPGSFPGGRAGA